MAQRIFVDAGAFIALYRESDDHHEAAEAGWQKIESQKISCVTTNLVLLEVMNFLQQSFGNVTAARRYRRILSTESFDVRDPSRDVELLAVDILEKFDDQRIGWTDCVTFVIMKQLKIDRVFGFDRHFRYAGFEYFTEIN